MKKLFENAQMSAYRLSKYWVLNALNDSCRGGPCGRPSLGRHKTGPYKPISVIFLPLQRSWTFRLNGLFKPMMLAFALMLVLSNQAFADNSLNVLQDTLNRYQHVTAVFDQSTYDTNGSVSLTSHGSMALLRPGYFRWQTDTPNKQIISASPKDLTIYDVDLQQASIQPVDKSVGEAPAALLLNSSEVLASQYRIEPQSKRSAGNWFRLTPKDADAPMAWVDLQLQNQQLVSMQIMDNLGQLTAIRFSQQNFNAKLTPESFNLHLPKGVDVVREAGSKS